MLSPEIILRFNPFEPENKPAIVKIDRDDKSPIEFCATRPEFYQISENSQLIEIIHENFKLRMKNKELEDANKALVSMKTKLNDRDSALERVRFLCEHDSRLAVDLAHEWFASKFGSMTEAEKEYVHYGKMIPASMSTAVSLHKMVRPFSRRTVVNRAVNTELDKMEAGK